MTQTKGSVIWPATMSLDGYIAAPGDEMAWVFDHIDPTDPAAADVPDRLGAVIAGRRSFEVGRRDGMEVYDGSWSGAQFLLTNRAVDSLPAGLQVRSGKVGPVVEEALRTASGRDVGIIGADVARQALEAHAVDEVIVHIAPVLLGGGVRFRGAEAGGAGGRGGLELVSAQTHGDLVTIHYRVRKRRAGLVGKGSVGPTPQDTAGMSARKAIPSTESNTVQKPGQKEEQ